MKALWLSIVAWFTSWWTKWLSPSNELAFYQAVFVASDEDVPKVLSDRKVFIVGVPGNEWLVVMQCPCGCGSRIPLNLLEAEKPYWGWGVDPNSGAVTLTPSVWRKVGCRSHFFLRNGLIQWC